MDKELYAGISDWFDAHEEALIEDICRIVRIPSVSDPDEEVKPFGQGCRDCMDEMLKIGREHGFIQKIMIIIPEASVLRKRTGRI